MAYLIDEVSVPSNFVKEEIPEAFRNSFCPSRLYAPVRSDRWPTWHWVVDKTRNVAMVNGASLGTCGAHRNNVSTVWGTLLVGEHPVGLLYNVEIQALEGTDPNTKAQYCLTKLASLHLYLPPEVFGLKFEVVALAEEALFVDARGPYRPWIRGVVAELAGVHPHTDYADVKHPDFA